jgi:hypothetical protein
MTVKKKYEELQKKYKLPSYNEMDNEFEIACIEDSEKFLLRNIRRKIAEKLEAYNKVIEAILMPESNLTSLYEYQIFSDEEKRKLYLFYKKFMYFDRMSIETSVDEDDKKTSEFINEFWKEWPAMKKKISEIVRNLKDGWTKEIKLKEEKSYLG